MNYNVFIKIKKYHKYFSVLKNVSEDLLISASMGHTIGGINQFSLTDSLVNGGIIKNPIIRESFSNLDRKYFVHINDPKAIYANRPLKISSMATISTPQHHAQIAEYMFNDIDHIINNNNKLYALDIGSGSGYLTILFAKILCKLKKNYNVNVTGLEIDPDLVLKSIQNIRNQYPTFINNGIVRMKGVHVGLDNIGNYLLSLNNSITHKKTLYHFIHIGFELLDIQIAHEICKYLAPDGILLVPIRKSSSSEQKLIKMTRDGDSKTILIKELMTVLCQPALSKPPVNCNDHKVITSSMSKMEKRKIIKEKLDTWKKDFFQVHNRLPSRNDLMADEYSNRLFVDFSKLTK